MTDAKDTRPSLTHGTVPRVAWVLLVVLSTTALALDRSPLQLPFDLVPTASVAVTGCYAAALANRVGSYPWVALALGVALGSAAVLSDQPVLRAGVAVATAVLSGVLAVLETVPARGFLVATREVVIASVLAVVGALAVAGYDGDVQPGRFRYLTLVAGLVAALVLVNVLGAGLHGLGRRGLLVLVGGVALLVAAVAYGEALTRWGTPELVHAIETTRIQVRTHLHGVPHPMQVLLGFPALTWGVFMRARRRQGWWVSAFGVVATVSTACALVDPTIALRRVALSGGYSLLLGLVVGYLVIRVDLFFTGPRGARARRDEEATAHRPEPGRSRALR